MGVRKKYVECSQAICWHVKRAVVYSLRFMTSLALGVVQVSSTKHDFSLAEWALNSCRDLVIVMKVCLPVLHPYGYCTMLVIVVFYRCHFYVILMVASLHGKLVLYLWQHKGQSLGRRLSGRIYLRSMGSCVQISWCLQQQGVTSNLQEATKGNSSSV